MQNIKDLTFLRLIIAEAFQAIPTRLFESIEAFTPEMIDRIYRFSPEIMTDPIYNQQGTIVCRVPKPSVWVAVMQDIGKEIKGFVWLEFDIIEPKTVVRAYSVDAEYGSENGDVIEAVNEYIGSLVISDGLKGNIQYTNNNEKPIDTTGSGQSEDTGPADGDQ